MVLGEEGAPVFKAREKTLTTEAQRTRRKKDAGSKTEAGIKKLFSFLLLAPCFSLHPSLR
jgi:hypothetical protein